MSDKKAITVVLGENDPIMRRGMRQILEEDGYLVIGEAGNLRDVMLLVLQQRPAILIVELRINGAMNGFKHISMIRQMTDSVAVIVSNSSYHDSLVNYLYDLGVSGYLIKGNKNGIDRFLEIVGAVSRREHPPIADDITYVGSNGRAASPNIVLTVRELNVFTLVAQGRSHGEIAVELGIAPTSVSNLVLKIKQKLRVDVIDFGWVAREYGFYTEPSADGSDI